jgi:hypothetical protein
MALPTTPSGLAATAGSNGTVSLSWTANPSADAVIEYRLYRTPAAWFAPELVAAVATTSYTDASGELLPNTQWYYFVVAVNSSGTSPASTAVSVTIPAPSAVSLAVDGAAHANFSGTSGSLSLTTKNANDVIIACVQVNGTTVASITGPGLTFTLRKRQATTDSPPNYEEVWYAVAPSALSAGTITVTLSAATTYCTVDVFGISGANTTTIFDGNSSLPAATTNGPVTLSTSNAHDFIFGTYRLYPQIPAGGTGWTVISAADYQLVEYQIVTTAQSNLQIALGSGDSSSGIGYAGIGDAIISA